MIDPPAHCRPAQCRRSFSSTTPPASRSHPARPRQPRRSRRPSSADYGIYRIRQQVAPIQGITLPLPYGGKPRQIMVDLDPQALLAKVDLGGGRQQRGQPPEPHAPVRQREARAARNIASASTAAPTRWPRSTRLPVKVVNGATVYVRDVAHVRDGFAVQTNASSVQDGRPDRCCSPSSKKGAGPRRSRSSSSSSSCCRASGPPRRPASRSRSSSISRSSSRAAIAGVLTEEAIAACLTGLMILLFLGSWRSTLVVIASIPLSILTSLAILSLTRPDAQRDDARRARAGGRHPRRRRHGRDREHPPQPGARQAPSCRRSSTAPSRSRRRPSSRRSRSASSSSRSSS